MELEQEIKDIIEEIPEETLKELGALRVRNIIIKQKYQSEIKELNNETAELVKGIGVLQEAEE